MFQSAVKTTQIVKKNFAFYIPTSGGDIKLLSSKVPFRRQQRCVAAQIVMRFFCFGNLRKPSKRSPLRGELTAIQ
jgi:hypothetical protein